MAMGRSRLDKMEASEIDRRGAIVAFRTRLMIAEADVSGPRTSWMSSRAT